MRPLFVATIFPTESGNLDFIKQVDAEHFDFTSFSEFDSFNNTQDEKEYDVIVMDRIIFDNRVDEGVLDQILSDENIVLYSPDENWENKKRFLEKGGWMLATGTLSDERLIFFLNQLLQIENKLIPAIRKKNLFVGDIRTFSLKELLLSSFMEKKSFEIFLTTENCNGKIMVQNGNIEEASWGKSADMEAVIRMLFIQDGKIRVVPPRRDFPYSKLLPTILSILHEFEFQKQIASDWVKEMNDGNLTAVRFVWKLNNKYLFKSHQEKKLAEELATGLRFDQIIESVDNMPLKTLEILHQFYDAGNLQILQIGEADQDSGGYLHIENKSQWLRTKLLLDTEEKSARLLVLGHSTSGKSKFVSMLEGKGVQTKQIPNMESVRIAVAPDLNFHILGLSLHEDIMGTMDVLADKMNGYIFFIDAMLEDKFEYTNYLINYFLNSFTLPSLIILTNTQHLSEDAVKMIQSRFTFSKPVRFIVRNLDKLRDPYLILNEMEMMDDSQVALQNNNGEKE